MEIYRGNDCIPASVCVGYGSAGFPGRLPDILEKGEGYGNGFDRRLNPVLRNLGCEKKVDGLQRRKGLLQRMLRGLLL